MFYGGHEEDNLVNRARKVRLIKLVRFGPSDPSVIKKIEAVVLATARYL